VPFSANRYWANVYLPNRVVVVAAIGSTKPQVRCGPGASFVTNPSHAKIRPRLILSSSLLGSEPDAYRRCLASTKCLD